MAQDEDIDRHQELVQDAQEALDREDAGAVEDILSDLHPSEAAALLESLPTDDRDALWEHIAVADEGEVLSYLSDGVRETLLEQMEPHEVAAATEGLDVDDAADILQDLPEDRINEVLRSMDEQNRQRLEHILTYDEDTAGGIMNTDAITVRSDVSIEVVLRYLRRLAQVPDHTDSLFVVDRDNRYLGVLRLTRVLTAPPERLVEETMERAGDGLPATMAASDVANLFDQRDLLSAAVVDDNGRLLGRITVDDVLDIVRERGDHSFLGLAGLDEEDDIFAPVVTTARRRALWLGINLATAFLAAWVIGQFEVTIAKLVALAVLMPVVASMGGVAGSQTLTIVIRALALGQLGSANARILVAKEMAVGVFNGLLWALVVAVVAGLWFHDAQLGIIIAAAIVINLFTAAFAGATIPLALKRMNIDPAIAGGVVLTTVTDVIGFFAFLGLATVFLV